MSSTTGNNSPYGNEQGLTAPLDTRYRVETPEGIDLLLRPASLLPRALAFFIDLLIRGGILLVMFVVLALLGQFGIGLGMILLFLVNWWYMVLFEVLNQGRSPASRSWACAWCMTTAPRWVGPPPWCATCCASSTCCPSATPSG